MSIYEFVIPRGNNESGYIFVLASSIDLAIFYANENLKDNGNRYRVDESNIILNEPTDEFSGVFETINL